MKAGMKKRVKALLAMTAGLEVLVRELEKEALVDVSASGNKKASEGYQATADALDEAAVYLNDVTKVLAKAVS